MRWCGLQSFSLWATTIGGPRAIEYAARHPDQVHRLILYGTFARGTDVMPAENLQALATLARVNWTMAAQVLADMAGRREHPDSLVGFADLFRESATGGVVARILEEVYAADVRDLLPAVKAQTLVLHRRGDPIFPFAAGQAMAALIPDSRFVPLEGTSHTPALGDAQSVLDAFNAFLKEDEPAPAAGPEAPASAFRTVLFTDLAGSTAMMRRLGDEAGREVLREHERITREVLKEHRGAEVKTMGDGFMASFSSVTRAVECAIALQRAFAQRNESLPARPEPVEGQGAAHGSTGSPRAAPESEPVLVRVGLNAGEPIEEEGPDGRADLFGQTVILAARIAALAEGGEILVSVAVRELCAGKRFLFADRGDVVLRGFEDAVRVYEVHWRE
jgi:class 3 adenylate cyclase